MDQIGDDNLKKIHKRIKELKQSRELEGKYMQFEELLKLVMQMTASGKADQIPRLQTDKEFYNEMLKEYNL